MSTYSEYKGLELPTSPEHYDIAIVNKNNMVIDSELHKLDLKNESQDNLLAAKEELHSEVSRATEKENSILEKLDDEIIRAETSESEIMDLLENEINRATLADETNSNNLAAHIEDENNPHKVNKEQVGLGNVENKSSATIRSEITKTNVTNALGYTPYTPTEVDNKLAALETNIDWKESVGTFNDIAAAYPEPKDGWTVNVNDTDYTYRYNGDKWIPISANAIPKATDKLDGLISAEDKKKLDGVAAGAEVNVQADWNITDSTSDAFIKNKPASLPANGGTAKTISDTLPISKGGTGKTTAKEAANELIESLVVGQEGLVPSDTAIYLTHNGTEWVRRKIGTLVSYIKSKLATVFVNKSGDTMTDNLTIEKNTANKSTYFIAKRTDTNTTVDFGIGTGGVNHGVYSTTLGKWIVYADEEKIHLNGDAQSVKSRGNVTAETENNLPEMDGLSMSYSYKNGYPTNYGNVLTLNGTGVSQLYLPWSGTDGGVTYLRYRNKRDQADSPWSPWNKIAFTDDDNAGYVRDTGDTMTGYLYNTAGNTNDGRKSILYCNGLKLLFPDSAAGGLYFGSLKDENSYFSTMGYYYNSVNPENANYFYFGSAYNNPNGKVKAGEFVGKLTGNAEAATKLATARTIDGVSFNGSAAITHYGTCSTAAATAAKVVTCTGFTLVTGAEITIKFTVTNTASNPTLNVNGTGAKAIQYRGAAISAGYLAANRTYRFLYDGTYYQLVGDINTDTTTATKLGSASVGSGIKPIYLNAGTATASASTVGSSTRPVYMNAGTVTQCGTSLGVDITGNAATATKATQDGDGNVIADTYANRSIYQDTHIITGTNNSATATNTVAVGGSNNTAGGAGHNAVIGGMKNTCLGAYAVIVGGWENTTGYSSNCIMLGGRGLTGANHQCIAGHYNNETIALGLNTSFGTGTGTAFCIGNGTDAASYKSNAARIDYNGKLWCKAAYSSTGADYAELFEWTDGNPNKEDRRGYFVTMDGDKIKKASTGDWILGVVSANPCVLGNTDMEWNGQFLKDEFGAFLTEEFTEKQKRTRIDQITNDDGDTEDVEVEYEEEVTGTRYVLNPDYDPEQKYVDRISRPEWDAIGMMGVLSVYDDGSCQVNGFCSCNDSGIATASETGYRVIQRLNNNIIKIVFK